MIYLFKGTVQQEPSTPVFHKAAYSGVNRHALKRFQIRQIFVELFVLQGTVQQDFFTPVFSLNSSSRSQ
jgi:hypothetical protein